MLYSCDLEKKHYLKSHLDVGYVVKDYFPQFQKKWKLYIFGLDYFYPCNNLLMSILKG